MIFHTTAIVIAVILISSFTLISNDDKLTQVDHVVMFLYLVYRLIISIYTSNRAQYV